MPEKDFDIKHALVEGECEREVEKVFSDWANGRVDKDNALLQLNGIYERYCSSVPENFRTRESEDISFSEWYELHRGMVEREERYIGP